jgi:hypothetical protein
MEYLLENLEPKNVVDVNIRLEGMMFGIDLLYEFRYESKWSKVNDSMMKMFSKKFYDKFAMCWDKLMMGYELFVDKFYEGVGYKVEQLLESFKEPKLGKVGYATKLILPMKWKVEDFVGIEDEKDDERGMIIALIRLAKIVTEENIKKRGRFLEDSR